MNSKRSLSVLALYFIQSITYAQLVDSLPLFGTNIDIDVYGNLFVIDAESSLLTVYTKAKNQVRQFGGQGWGTEQFDSPRAVWASNGLDIFIADYGNHRIQRYDKTLSYVSTLYTRDNEDQSTRFGYPTDMTLTRLGDLFVCDSENARILKLTRSTQPDRSFGGFEGGKGRLFAPVRIEAGPRDNLYVLDKNRVVVFDTFGNFVQELGTGLFRTPDRIYADTERVLVLDGDLLFRFDDGGRPMIPVSISESAGGRIKGEDVLSMTYARSVLFALTSEGLFLVRLPPAREQREGSKNHQ